MHFSSSWEEKNKGKIKTMSNTIFTKKEEKAL